MRSALRFRDSAALWRLRIIRCCLFNSRTSSWSLRFDMSPSEPCLGALPAPELSSSKSSELCRAIKVGCETIIHGATENASSGGHLQCDLPRPMICALRSVAHSLCEFRSTAVVCLSIFALALGAADFAEPSLGIEHEAH